MTPPLSPFKKMISPSLYAAARRTAVVAIVFIIIVGGIMTARYFKLPGNLFVDPRTELLKYPGTLSELKGQIAENPTDKDLQNRLREYDRRLREAYFSETEFYRRGGYLIAAGMLAFFFCLRIISIRDAKTPVGEEVKLLIRRHQVQFGISLVLFLTAGLALCFVQAFDIGVTSYTVEAKAPDFASSEEMRANWPRFRGVDGLGAAYGTGYPTGWDGESGENIIWKTELPLPGENSPVIWNDRIFLAGATKDKRVLFCLDRADGNILWSTELSVKNSPKESPNVWDPGVLSACTVATDGKRVFAIFANGDIGGFDFDGKQLWGKALGLPQNSYGHATSLLTIEDKLIVQFDQGTSADDGLSRIFALDCRTGRQIWDSKRPVANTWTTPITPEIDSVRQIVTAASGPVISYEPATGKELWQIVGVEGEVAPSPAFGGGTVIVANEGYPVVAIKITGENPEKKWEGDYGSPNISSPLATDKLVIMGDSTGLATCFDIESGETLWEHEFKEPFQSSPTLAENRIYLMDETGTMFIFDHTKEFKLISTAKLGEKSNCSPAFVDGRIYIRGKKNLFCIGSRK